MTGSSEVRRTTSVCQQCLEKRLCPKEVKSVELRSLSEERRNGTCRVSIIHMYEVTVKELLIVSETPGDRSVREGENYGLGSLNNVVLYKENFHQSSHYSNAV